MLLLLAYRQGSSRVERNRLNSDHSVVLTITFCRPLSNYLPSSILLSTVEPDHGNSFVRCDRQHGRNFDARDGESPMLCLG